MIPVVPQPEPGSFDAEVRQPGLAWLAQNNIPLNGKLPTKPKAPPHWRKSLDDLHTSYGGICAYLCIFIERCSGGVSVDHYVPKSQLARDTYEWSNYRLACSMMNSRKRDFSTALDPFTLAPDTFHLELITGRIYPNPALTPAAILAADASIDRLGLDKPCREMRARRFGDYLSLRKGAPDPDLEGQLKRYFPFIWHEANRQGVL